MGALLVLLLFAVLTVTTLRPLWVIWQEDPALSHGLLLAVGTGVLLWMRRRELRRWESAAVGGMALLIAASLLHLAAVWADISFLKPLSFLGIAWGGIWFLGGSSARRVCAGPLGLLVFAIPWPTTLVSALAFPLQMISSSYAALFGGMLGLNIQRVGVHLTVLSENGSKSIYSILVAQECSGTTSLIVLLAVGYLTAYFTPVRWWGRVLLVLAVIPLALLANAVRLTIILLVGGLYSAPLAQWVHDHEQPVLVFLCSFGLLGIRQMLLALPFASLPAPISSLPASNTEDAPV